MDSDSPRQTEQRVETDGQASDVPAPKIRWWRRFGTQLLHTLSEIRQTPWQTAAVLSAVAVATVLLGMALSLIPHVHPQGTPQERLQLSLKALEQGEFATARRMATDLRAVPGLTFEELGIPAYVLGATLAADAEQHWSGEERRNIYLIASRYLEEARERGFPEGHEREGTYLLGVTLYQTGRLPESLPVLTAIRESQPEHVPEMDRYLSHVYAELDPPDLRQAMWHNNQYLSNADLPVVDRLEELLHQSRLQMNMDSNDEARQTLAQVARLAENAPELDDARSYLLAATVMNGRLLLREAEQQENDPEDPDPEAAKTLYQAAKDLFQTAHLKSLDNSETSYLLGVALRKLGDLASAESQFTQTRRRNYTTPEAFAAGIEAAEIQRLQANYDESTESYCDVLRDAPEPAVYTNPWISLEEFRERILDAYHQALAQQRFQHADTLVDNFFPTFPREEMLQLKAETQQAWGEHLKQQADRSSGTGVEKLSQQGEQHFHRAGQMYKRLADMRLATRAYTDDLWLSAENYLRSGDFREGVKMLKRYMRNEPQKRRPRALAQLGNALLSLDRVEEALVPLRECLEFHPKHPDSYRARIHAAHASFETGDLTSAKDLLRQNLEHEALAPQSIEWRDSQFLLGEYLFKEGQIQETRSRQLGVNDPQSKSFQEAMDALSEAAERFTASIRRLSLAVKRYPDAPQTTKALYLIAEAHRHRAKYPQKRLPLETIETTQVELNRQIQKELREAIKYYTQLQATLSSKLDQYELDEVESGILRNCYFARAHALFDLGQYEEAIKAYSSATNRYQNEPASLEAYVQIASCYRYLGNPFKARGTLEQALVVLDQIPAEADFSTTRFKNRERWPELLNWLKSL